MLVRRLARTMVIRRGSDTHEERRESTPKKIVLCQRGLVGLVKRSGGKPGNSRNSHFFTSHGEPSSAPTNRSAVTARSDSQGRLVRRTRNPVMARTSANAR